MLKCVAGPTPSFTDKLVVVPEFLAEATFATFQSLGLQDLQPQRVNIPTHKRGAAIAYETIRAEHSFVAEFYQSTLLHRFISEIVGVRVTPTPPRDKSSCSILIYDRPGDRIGWHFDHNFYQGRHFTGLLSLVNERTGEAGLSSAELHVRTSAGNVVVPTPPNTFVLFEGACFRHCVTPLGLRERRVILSMTFCSDPTATLLNEAQRRIKDIAYFGVRALWS